MEKIREMHDRAAMMALVQTVLGAVGLLVSGRMLIGAGEEHVVSKVTAKLLELSQD